MRRFTAASFAGLALASVATLLAGAPAVASVAGVGPAGSVGRVAGRVDGAGHRPALKLARVSLRGGYAGFLPREHPARIAVEYPRTHRALAAPAASCAEPDCPVSYHGGPVQHSPQVYLLLWGPNWSPTGSDAQYLTSFLSGLGGQPQDDWSTTTSQYGDSSGAPTFSGSVLQGVYQDTSTPPSGATQDQLAAEADAFFSEHGLTDTIDTQIVVATQSGTCPQGFAASICGGNGDYCAWHSDSTVNDVPYVNLPYLPDAGSACGADSVSGPYDGFSIVGGHEYAESVTDPFPNSGWIDDNDPSGGEIADKCAWTDLGDITLSTGSFPMQPLWSNAADSCALSSVTPRVAVTGTTHQVYRLVDGNWVSLGAPSGGLVVGAPGVAVLDGSTYYFAVSSLDHNIYVRTAALGWAPYGPTGTACVDRPGVTVDGGSLVVACEGIDGHAYTSTASLPSGGLPSTGRFTGLGGGLSAGPAVAVLAGRLSYAVSGTNDRVYLSSGTGVWSVTPWSCLGAPALQTSPGGTAVFACTGIDHNLYYATEPASGGWSGTYRLSGQVLQNGPGVAATGPTTTFYVQLASGAIDSRTATGGWASLGGVALYGLAATAG